METHLSFKLSNYKRKNPKVVVTNFIFIVSQLRRRRRKSNILSSNPRTLCHSFSQQILEFLGKILCVKILKRQNNSPKCAKILCNDTINPTTVVALSCFVFLRTFYRPLDFPPSLVPACFQSSCP